MSIPKLFEQKPQEPFRDEFGNLCIWESVPKTDSEIWMDAVTCWSISIPAGIEMPMALTTYKWQKVIIEKAAA